MSTQFREAATDQWVGTRFFGGQERGVCFDWGRAGEDRADRYFEAAATGGIVVVDEYGNEWDGGQLSRRRDRVDDPRLPRRGRRDRLRGVRREGRVRLRLPEPRLRLDGPGVLGLGPRPAGRGG